MFFKTTTGVCNTFEITRSDVHDDVIPLADNVIHFEPHCKVMLFDGYFLEYFQCRLYVIYNL